MSHHYSGPDFGFPHGDARLDLTDLYAFPKPGDGGKSILIMNVHPSVRDFLDRENPLGSTTAEPFAPETLYELGHVPTAAELLSPAGPDRPPSPIPTARKTNRNEVPACMPGSGGQT